MIESVNLPLCPDIIAQYGGVDGLRRDLRSLGIDGVEGIFDGFAEPDDFPPDLLTGYHLTFYPDWLDFYRGDKRALEEKFGSLEAAYAFYGGEDGPETMLALYRADLRRAMALGAKYTVFHVSDVSIEEGYTYAWLHTNREVLDAAIEVIRALLRDVPPTFDFLVENQWWPGLTFTQPEETAYLLDAIPFPRKGIMLDTGHLMNCRRSIRTQRQGVDFLHQMLQDHGTLSGKVYGLHLHQSVSGAYVNAHIGPPPADLPREYSARFGASYAHILHIDRHRPWTDPAIAQVVERVAPKYLTHELAAGTRRDKLARTRRQRTTLEKGGLFHG